MFKKIIQINVTASDFGSPEPLKSNTIVRITINKTNIENKLMFKSPSQNYSTVNTSIDSNDVIITFEVLTRFVIIIKLENRYCYNYGYI